MIHLVVKCCSQKFAWLEQLFFDDTTNGADWLHPDWGMDAESQNVSSVNNDPPKSIYGRKDKIENQWKSVPSVLLSVLKQGAWRAQWKLNDQGRIKIKEIK